MSAEQPPDVERILGGLKDFQRDTVEYAFRRLWTDPDATRRFLVADEVGLGKTMVAKGVIAKTVDHLWNTGRRIDVVYICSNAQIARQNLSRLNVVGGSELRHADRLTLLPRALSHLRDHKVNFVSFTPGTSFTVGESTGKISERVLLYWMLARHWGREVTGGKRWARFFEAYAGRESFESSLAQFDADSLDDEICGDFGSAVEASPGLFGSGLASEVRGCAMEMAHLRGKPVGELKARRNRLIGELRRIVAEVAVEHLEPDLVILDEFQRFKSLLKDTSEGGKLASRVFDHADAKVLLLSATPYKMYTLPDEPEGDDHYRDFTDTIESLGGAERARAIEHHLRVMREGLLAQADEGQMRAARDEAQHQLTKVMCRTERLALTADRDGMLEDRSGAEVRLTAQDVRGWQAYDSISRAIDSYDPFELWRSTPYLFNLMERHGYQLRAKFDAALEARDPRLLEVLRHAEGVVDLERLRRYRSVDPGNAKMRGLVHDVLDNGAWRLLWIPPSLPYYALEGAYGDPGLASFTKRLIFSAWAVVPKAIATVTSYEAERRAMSEAHFDDRSYDSRPPSPLLRFAVVEGRPATMTAFSLLYPSVALAEAGDPLSVTRRLRARGVPSTRENVEDAVRDTVGELLASLPSSSESREADVRWYWVAPLLLDGERSGEFVAALRRHRDDRGDDRSRLLAHLDAAAAVEQLELGAQPSDLADVLVRLAMGGLGTCALRALSRSDADRRAWADVNRRVHAFIVAEGLRSLFNRPESIALLRSSDGERYWREVLRHSVEGCLQAVLDEYAHVLVESEGLQDASDAERTAVIAEVMRESMSLQSASNVVADVRSAVDDAAVGGDLRVRSHFAARFGRAQSSEGAAIREASTRRAFNSPFRPFVLASTSVGQEGLDFHTYCHAVMHWNLPANPVDLEQREGRVHRYKGHAVRKNVAAAFGDAVHDAQSADPWSAVFDAAVAARAPGESDMSPFWVFTRDGGAVIERYVPALPLSREALRYRRLQRTVGAYRLVMGQPRQKDLLEYVGRSRNDEGEDLSWLRLDLSPPPRDHGIDVTVDR